MWSRCFAHHRSLPSLFSFRPMASPQQSNKRLKRAAASVTTPGSGYVRTGDSSPTMIGGRTPKKTPRQLSVRNVSSYHSNNTCFLQIYGTGFDTGDTVPTVLLFFDQCRFLFNAGEGIQRYCTEHKIKMSKIDHIFFTRICSETAGGLPGLLLTLAGMGDSGMAAHICGPGDFQNLVNAIRSFVPNAATVYTRSFGNESTTDISTAAPFVLVDNDLVKISAVVLCPQLQSASNMEEKTVRNVSAIYICELPQVLGKFDPKKALAKGLKPGPKYSILQRGESVMSDDGSQMIYPEDVLGPSNPGPIMILVDCPKVTYIPALTSASSLKSFYSGAGKVVNCIVHLSPYSVTKHSEYKSWMENFKEAKHIMAGRQGEQPGRPILKSSANILAKLNFICPSVFPIDGFLLSNNDGLSIQHQDFSKCIQTIIAENLLKFHLKPIATLGPDNSCVPESFDILASQEEFARESAEIAEAKDHLLQDWNKDGNIGGIQECIQNASREEMEIVFLGTGSSQPSKYRNVSAIYVHLFLQGGMLLDCGEGTYAQLKRRYGVKGADEILQNLRCIWISHIHADHHSGLPRLLAARKKLMANCPNSPILVIGPRQLKRFLDAYAVVEDLDMVFLDCSQTTAAADRCVEEQKTKEMDICNENRNTAKGVHFQQGLDVAGREIMRKALDFMSLKSLRSVQVVHCLNAYGVSLESQPKDGRPGWKLVYSGDTRPCEELIEASAGATVLIHEATFDDSMPVEAIMKNHSTTREALEVAKSAEVYRVILTHFSQRYPKIPVLNDSYTDHACIAFDMMSVNLVDLPSLPKLLPAFKMLFRDELLMEEEEGIEAVF